MRHFAGLLIGVLVTAVLLFGGGWAAQDAMRGAAPTSGLATADARMWIGLGVMSVMGLVFGLVVIGRLSPLAGFVPSMVLLAWTVVYALDVNRALSLIPDDPSMHEAVVQVGQGMTTLLGSGVFAMLGVALFIPVLMPSRWAARHDDDDDFDEGDTQPYF